MSLTWRTAALSIAATALLTGHANSMSMLRAQEADATQRQHVVPAIDGRTLFATYCVVCHGQSAEGHGPMAAILKTAVPDLTVIARKNGGVFPLTRVENIVAGTESSGLGHGTRQMPVWGPLFSQISDDRDYSKVRLYNVAKYIESLQKR